MKDDDVLAPATPAEAELADAARQHIMTALNRAKSDPILLTLHLPTDDAQEGQKSTEIRLPPKALRIFADVLRQMAKHQPIWLVPRKQELTTQEAAHFLNVSRPFVIKEIEAGRLYCRKVNRHRRIDFQELVRYRDEQKSHSEQALKELTKLSEDRGQDF